MTDTTPRAYTRAEVATILTESGWTFDKETVTWSDGEHRGRLCWNDDRTDWWIQRPSVDLRLPKQLYVVRAGTVVPAEG